MNAILPAEVPTRVCILRHCGCSYAVALQDVQEISPVESLAKLPGLPPVIKGVSNVRGTIVPIIDLRLMLRLPQFDQQASQFTVVLRHKDYQVGIVVDAVPEILTALPEQYFPVPEQGPAGSSGIVTGRLQLGEDFSDLLDVRGLVSRLESDAVVADLEEGTNLRVRIAEA